MSDLKGNLLSFISSTEECFSHTKQEERAGDLSYWTVGGSFDRIMSFDLSSRRFNLLPLSSHSSTVGNSQTSFPCGLSLRKEDDVWEVQGEVTGRVFGANVQEFVKEWILKSLLSRSPRWSDSLSVSSFLSSPRSENLLTRFKAFFTGRWERTWGRGGFRSDHLFAVARLNMVQALVLSGDL